MTPPPLEQLLADQGRLIRRLAAEVVGETHLAEDVVQEAWLRGLAERAPASEAGAWWRTVIRNMGRNLRLANGARKRRERAVARDERLPSTHDELERAELVARIAGAVQALPEPYRGVVSMRYWDDLAPREIARARGAPVATVKSQLQRGLQRLRAELADSDPSTRRGLLALALPVPRSGLFASALLMQVNLKIMGGALVLGALGVWVLASRGAAPSGFGEPSIGVGAATFAVPDGGDEPVEARVEAPELEGVGTSGTRLAGARVAAIGEGPQTANAMRLRGRVVDDAGAPLARAHLTFVGDAEASIPIELETTVEGTFEGLDVPLGDYKLAVKAVGCVPWEGRLNLPPGFDGALRDIVLQRGRALLGRIVTEAGDPVPGAELYLLEQAQPMSPVAVQLAGTTGVDGSFALAGLPLHTFFLGVSSWHLVPKLVRVAPEVEAEAGEEPLVVELAEGWTATVEIDGLGPVLPRLQVQVMPATGSPLANDEFVWRAHTQRRWPVENGEPLQILGLAPGERYYVQLEEARPSGHWRSGADVPLISEAAPRAKLSYEPRASVSVNVRSALDGGAVEGFDALIERWGIEWASLTPLRPASPLPVGTRRYSVDPGEPIGLRIEAAGFASMTLDPVVCEAGELRVMPTVHLQPAGVAVVTVRDAQTGAALAGATLRVREDWAQEPEVWRSRVRTDASGAAQVTLGSRSDAELHVSCKGYEPRILGRGALEGAVTVELEPACSATVHVVDGGGVPVEGIRISCRRTGDTDGEPLTGESDLEGRLTFNGLQAGEHIFAVVNTEFLGKRIMMGGAVATVHLSEMHEGADPVAADIQVGALTRVQVVVPARVSLAGRVLHGATPQAGVGLHWIDRAVGLDDVLSFTMLGESRYLTDAEGRFRLPALSAGEGTLVVEHPGRRFPIAIPLELSADRDGLEVQLPGATIRGTVRGPDGSPLPGAAVSVGVYALDGTRMRTPKVATLDAAGVMSFYGGEVPLQRFVADALGRYVVHGAPVGYSLRVTASTAATVGVTETLALIDGEEADLDFELGAAGELFLELRTPGGEAARNWLVSLEWGGEGTQAGHERVVSNEPSTRMGGLAPGPWTLTVTSLMEGDGEPKSKVVTIRASEATELTLQLDG